MGSLPTGRCIWRSASTATAPNKSSGSGSDPPTGESSKFWLTVLSELKSRGVADVCIVCCDGLTGLPAPRCATRPSGTGRHRTQRAAVRRANQIFEDQEIIDRTPHQRLARHPSPRRRHPHRTREGGLSQTPNLTSALSCPPSPAPPKATTPTSSSRQWRTTLTPKPTTSTLPAGLVITDDSSEK